MKKLMLTLLCLLASISVAEEIRVHVPGMVCQMCVQGMQKQFKSAVENVEKDIAVDLDTKMVTVKTKKKLTDEDIKKRVQNAGYNAEKIIRVAKIEKLPIKALEVPKREIIIKK